MRHRLHPLLVFTLLLIFGPYLLALAAALAVLWLVAFAMAAAFQLVAGRR